VRPTAPWLAVFGLRCGELAALALAGVLAWLAHPDAGEIGPTPITTIVVVTACWGWMCERLRAYDLGYVFMPRAGMQRQLCAWILTIAALILAAYSLKVSTAYPRLWVGMWLISGAVLPAAVRLSFTHVTRSWVREGRLAQRTVVVGTTEHGQRLAQHFHGGRDIRMRIIGFVHDDRRAESSHIGPYRILGNISYLAQMIRRNEVDQVVIALPWSEHERVMRTLNELADTPVDIRLAPELLRFEFLQQRAEMVGGVPLLRVLDRPVSGAAELLKAAEDRILGCLLMVLAVPVMLLAALAIKLDSRGPVFFRQTRYGFNNRRIKVWKFRTMHHNMTDADASVLTQRHDPRVTRVGRFLRRTSLDELPQLLNVLAGEMSLVGPRPHALQAKAGDQLYQDVMLHYAARHRVKPGLTGWAQVNGWRGETDTCEKLTRRVEHDLYYIDNWSLWLDLRILLRTARVLVGDKEAF
jgi:Undecaprenyl-phosphate glucose phosphotransferase